VKLPVDVSHLRGSAVCSHVTTAQNWAERYRWWGCSHD